MIILPIKKHFFEQIESGEKKIEYRRDVRYYNKMFTSNEKYIVFHFYKKEKLICFIEKIRLIENPMLEKKLPHLNTLKVWEIHLSNPQRMDI